MATSKEQPDPDALRIAYRDSRLKFIRAGGLGLLEALEKPAIAAGLRLHARVIADRQRATGDVR
jgi:hypothetical protein